MALPITPRAFALPDAGNPAFDMPAYARSTLRRSRKAAVASLDPSGHPFSSFAMIATEFDGTPFLMTSMLTLHARNFAVESRVSIAMVLPIRADPFVGPRLTVSGRVEAMTREEGEARYLARHPKRTVQARQFQDFRFWRVVPEAGEIIGGERVAPELVGADLVIDVSDAGELRVCEAEVVRMLNSRHADLRSMAVALSKGRDGPWKATGVDPEGIDLMLAEATARLTFPRRVCTPGEAEACFGDMLEEARDPE